MKKGLGVVLAVMLGLSSCSSGVSSLTPAPKQPEEEAELTIMHMDQKKEGFTSFIQEAEKALGITIRVKECPDNADNRQALISTILSSGDSSVDVITVNDEMISEFKYKEYLTPLDESVMPEEVICNYPQEYFQEICMADGKVYSVPFYMDVMVFWVNQELLEQAGLEHIETSEDFWKLSGILSEDQYVYGDAWERTYAYNGLSQFVNLFGGDYRDWLDPDTREAAAFMKKLLQEHMTSNQQMVDQYEQMEEKFINGKYGCIFMYSGAISQFISAGVYGADKIHIAALPEFREGKKATNIATWQYVLNNASENKETALAFLKYAAGKEGSLAYARATNSFPARLDVIEEESLDIRGIEQVREYLKSAELYARPLCPNSMAAITSMGTLFQKYVLGQIGEELFFEEAQELIEKYYENTPLRRDP